MSTCAPGADTMYLHGRLLAFIRIPDACAASSAGSSFLSLDTQTRHEFILRVLDPRTGVNRQIVSPPGSSPSFTTVELFRTCLFP